jgi:hypothetical protein
MGGNDSWLTTYSGAFAIDMRFSERFFGRKTSGDDASRAKLNGVGRAAMMQNLGRVNRNQKIHDALATRQMCKILTTPDLQLDDEMIAGGDIHVGTGSNTGFWIFMSVLVMVVGLLAAAGVWMSNQQKLLQPPTPPPPPAAKPGQYGIAVEQGQVF